MYSECELQVASRVNEPRDADASVVRVLLTHLTRVPRSW